MAALTDVELKAYLDANINTNNARLITGIKHNTWGTDIIDSKVNILDLADSLLWVEDAANNYVYPTTTSYGINLAKTTGANQDGVIYKNGVRFLYEFSYGLNGGGITPAGRNLFIGESSGNFTMGSTEIGRASCRERV